MKRILPILLLLPALLSGCLKTTVQEPDKDHVIRGKVIDIRDKKRIAGVEVMVMDFWTDFFQYSIPITGRDTTGSDGTFEVWYTLKQESDSRVLKMSNLPAGYQQGITIGLAHEGCIRYDPSGQYDMQQIFGGFRVEDEGYYIIELMPHTYVSFDMPTFPAAYGDRTVKLIAYDFCWPVSNIPFGDCFSCEEWYGDEFVFQMSDTAKWKTLNVPIYLRVGNEVRVEYEITHPNHYPLRETMTWQVPYGDTTRVQMVFEE